MHNFFDIFVGLFFWIIKFFRLRMYLGTELSDSRKFIDGASIPYSETSGLLFRLLVKVLSVERMNLYIVFAFSYTKSIIPACL